MVRFILSEGSQKISFLVSKSVSPSNITETSAILLGIAIGLAVAILVFEVIDLIKIRGGDK